MRKLHIDTLCIETTRRCNMACAHCMRGDAQNKDLNPELLNKFMAHVGSIGNLTPTGGEPTLNPQALNQIRDAIQKYHIHTQSLYLVTNGLSVSDEFLTAFLNLLTATDMEEEQCGLALSQDMFHSKIPQENIRRLSVFQCFRSHDKKTDWNHVSVINLGRANSLQNVSKVNPYLYQSLDYCEIDQNGDLNFCDIALTLTVDGDILPCGNYAYGDTETLRLCNIQDEDWVEQLADHIRRNQEPDEDPEQERVPLFELVNPSAR